MLEKRNSFDPQQIKKNTEEYEKEKNNNEEKIEELNKLIKKLSLQASARASLNLKKDQMKKLAEEFGNL